MGFRLRFVQGLHPAFSVSDASFVHSRRIHLCFRVSVRVRLRDRDRMRVRGRGRVRLRGFSD